MTFPKIDFYQIFDLFMLLLIGMGPKIALVPFLEMTKELDSDTRKQVATKMVKAGVTVALVLVVLGAFLMKLLHFSPGAVSIAGGIVLLLFSLHMIIGSSKKDEDHAEKAEGRSPMQMALYPLAVPLLLNPIGIAVLVTTSGQTDSLGTLIIVIGIILLMGLLDLLVFKNLDSFAEHLDPSRLAVTEAVFGILLAALAVQEMLNGLQTLGLITMTGGH
jgi:multiple antibiotic resistance protein